MAKILFVKTGKIKTVAGTAEEVVSNMINTSEENRRKANEIMVKNEGEDWEIEIYDETNESSRYGLSQFLLLIGAVSTDKLKED